MLRHKRTSSTAVSRHLESSPTWAPLVLTSLLVLTLVVMLGA